MVYNNDILDDIVSEAMRDNYDEFLDYFKKGQKLPFVKLVKEHTLLGLKEAKINSDVIFDGGVGMFERTFGLTNQRKQKLDKLKKRLLSQELIKEIKRRNEEELEEVVNSLDLRTIENVLEKFLG